MYIMRVEPFKTQICNEERKKKKKKKRMGIGNWPKTLKKNYLATYI